MAFTKVADATVAVPLPSGKNQYVRIGSVLQSDSNDSSKGLPYMLMLDPWINLGKLHDALQAQGSQIPVSFYRSSQPVAAQIANQTRPRPTTGFDAMDDDIPF